MQKLTLNTGIEEYMIEDTTGKELGVLRVNTSDPNFYTRFMDLYNELPEISEKYQDLAELENAKLDEKGFPLEEVSSEMDTEINTEIKKVLPIFKNLDTEVKEKLKAVFGTDNDFDMLFDGMNILANTDTGKPVLENFLEQFMPLVETNIEKRDAIVKEKAANAVAKAKQNRAQRRASIKK